MGYMYRGSFVGLDWKGRRQPYRVCEAESGALDARQQITIEEW